MVLDTRPFGDAMPEARVFQNALPPDLFRRFQAWAVAIHPTPQDRTVWCPLNRKPRFLPERVIHELYSLIKPSTSEYRGAEWWMGYRNPWESLHYHVDRDESLFKKKKITLPPLLATVFYVSSAGGPTFIPHDFIRRSTGKVSRAPVTSALKIYPRPNKYLAFSGNLFHSVLPEEKMAGSGELRITFIVNFWNKRPQKPVCIDPDPSFIAKALPLELSRSRYS